MHEVPPRVSRIAEDKKPQPQLLSRLMKKKPSSRGVKKILRSVVGSSKEPASSGDNNNNNNNNSNGDDKLPNHRQRRSFLDKTKTRLDKLLFPRNNHSDTSSENEEDDDNSQESSFYKITIVEIDHEPSKDHRDHSREKKSTEDDDGEDLLDRVVAAISSGGSSSRGDNDDDDAPTEAETTSTNTIWDDYSLPDEDEIPYYESFECFRWDDDETLEQERAAESATILEQQPRQHPVPAVACSSSRSRGREDQFLLGTLSYGDDHDDSTSTSLVDTIETLSTFNTLNTLDIDDGDEKEDDDRVFFIYEALQCLAPNIR